MKSMLFDARMKHDSGIGVYIQNLLPELRKHFKLTVLGSNEADIPMPAPIYSIAEQVAFAKIKGRYDLMWSPHFNVPIFNPARKTIVTIHDVFHLAFFNLLPLKQKLYAQAMLQKAASSNVIFTVSEFSRNEISKHLGTPLYKIKVVYNGIDTAHFSQRYSDKETTSLREKYRLATDYVLFVGNVKPHKNLKNALLAFKAFVLSNTEAANLKFVIVGKRDGFITGDTTIAAMSHEEFFKERVDFTGWVPDEDLPFIYQQARVFMFTSLYEGFGFPPLEAMAAGCPVISSDAACMPEIYGDAAVYFNASSVEASTNALDKIFNKTTNVQALIKKGRDRAAEFTWEKSNREALAYLCKLNLL